MPKNEKYKSPLGIISSWVQRTGHSPDKELDETLILQKIHEGMGKLMCAPMWDEQIVLLPVKEYRAELPKNHKAVIQAGYKLDPEDYHKYRYSVSEYVQKGLGNDCELTISLNCPKCHKEKCDCKSPVVTVDADRIWRAENPHFEARFMDHYYGHFYLGNGFYGSGYHPEFRLMRAKQNNFHALRHHIKECINLVTDCEVEYALNENYMIVPFREGTILLSYLGERMDEQGYRLVPDNDWVISYLVDYIEEGMAYMEARRNNDYTFYSIAKQNMTESFFKARGKLNIPEYHQLKQFWRRKMNRLIDYNARQDFENIGRFMPDQYRLPLEDEGLSINMDDYRVRASGNYSFL